MKKNSTEQSAAVDSAKGFASLLCVAFAAFIAVWQQSPPSAIPASAPPAEFSSGRAMEDLRALTRESHPMGTRAHAAVRELILARLSAAGLSPEVQRTTVVNRAGSPYRAGTVQNILARLPGAGGGKAVLLAAHYDSVPNSFGAADDGAAVASMLETLRALKAAPPLRNDVIFLFSDGEEVGLLGAGAFVKEHPWAKDVGVVLNFEGRGRGGPSIMFETSPHNGWLVRQFAAAAPRPVATSMAYEIYRRLPNDTDLTVFKEAGLAGLNFAFIEGGGHYHTALDRVENLDERSLQHHGSYALSLARHFGNASFERARETDAVYFDLFGRALVHYPGVWATVFTALTCLLFVGVVVWGLRRRALSAAGLAFGFLGFLLCLVGAAAATYLLWFLYALTPEGRRALMQGVPYNGHFYSLAFVALAFAATAALINLLRGRIGVLNLSAGVALCWLLLAVLTTLYAPGASYLFTWPLLFALTGLYFYSRRAEGAAVTTKLFAALTLCALPAAVLLAPSIYNISIAIPLGVLWAVSLLVALWAGLLVPHLGMLSGRVRWFLPVGALLCALLLIAVGALTSGYDDRHPEASHLFYAVNADDGKAVWASADFRPNEWTAQVFSGPYQRAPLSDLLPLTSARFLQRPASGESPPAPEVALLGDTSDNGVRTLRVRVTSRRQAPVVTLYVDKATPVRAATVNGKPINFVNAAAQNRAGAPWALRYFALPPEGIEVSLEIEAGQPAQLKVVDQSYGLPALTPRPERLMPSPQAFGDSTIVGKTFAF